MNSYQVSISFQTDTTPSNQEQQTTIQFLAPSDREAARGVAKWWANRHKVIPEYFRTLLCVKIYRMVLGEIDADGYLRQSIGFPFFEWKVDAFQGDYPTYAERKRGLDG